MSARANAIASNADVMILSYLIASSSAVRASVRSSRYLTMIGVATDSPHSRPRPARHRPRAWHDDRAFRNDERPPVGSMIRPFGRS